MYHLFCLIFFHNLLEMALSVSCDVCDELNAVVHCDECDQDFCAEDDAAIHKPARLQAHKRKQIATEKSPNTNVTASAPATEAVSRPQSAGAPLVPPSSSLTVNDGPKCTKCSGAAQAVVNCEVCGKVCATCNRSLHSLPGNRMHRRQPMAGVRFRSPSMAFPQGATLDLHSTAHGSALSAAEGSLSQQTMQEECELCDDEKATVNCPECGKHFCDGCDVDIHKPAKLASHKRNPLETFKSDQSTVSPNSGTAATSDSITTHTIIVAEQHDNTTPKCKNCNDQNASVFCEDCRQYYCEARNCDADIHKSAKMATHVRRSLHAEVTNTSTSINKPKNRTAASHMSISNNKPTIPSNIKNENATNAFGGLQPRSPREAHSRNSFSESRKSSASRNGTMVRPKTSRPQSPAIQNNTMTSSGFASAGPRKSRIAIMLNSDEESFDAAQNGKQVSSPKPYTSRSPQKLSNSVSENSDDLSSNDLIPISSIAAFVESAVENALEKRLSLPGKSSRRRRVSVDVSPQRSKLAPELTSHRRSHSSQSYNGSKSNTSSNIVADYCDTVMDMSDCIENNKNLPETECNKFNYGRLLHNGINASDMVNSRPSTSRARKLQQHVIENSVIHTNDEVFDEDFPDRHTGLSRRFPFSADTDLSSYSNFFGYETTDPRLQRGPISATAIADRIRQEAQEEVQIRRKVQSQLAKQTRPHAQQLALPTRTMTGFSPYYVNRGWSAHTLPSSLVSTAPNVSSGRRGRSASAHLTYQRPLSSHSAYRGADVDDSPTSSMGIPIMTSVVRPHSVKRAGH